MHAIGHGFEEVTEKVARDAGGRLLVQFNKGELGRAVDGDEQVKLALLGPDLGEVDVEVADRIALEFAAVGLVAVDLRQATDPVALKASVQRGSREVRDRRLEAVQTIIQRQQRVPPEDNHDGFILDRQHRRAPLGPWAHRPPTFAASTSRRSSG